MLDFLFALESRFHASAPFFHAWTYASFLHAFMWLSVFVWLFSFYFVCFQNKIKNWKIKKIQKQCVFVYIGTCVPWMAIETNFSKLCIFCSLDEHLYAQLCKWALWLLFVMSKIKLSFVLNTHITFFDEKN